MTVPHVLLKFAAWLIPLTPSRALSASLLFAQGEGAGSKYAVSWGVILLTIILGILITVKSSHRKMEFKRHGIKWDKE